VFTICTQAQVAVNITGNNPASSAMLDVSSTNKGMLMPRMTSAQRKAILSPEKGLLVFDTDRETIYFFNGIKWKPMMTATESTAPMISRTPEGGKSHSEFGASVDIYDNYVVVGAPSDSAQGVTGGAVYVFVKENGIWKQQAKLSAPTPAVADAFGKAVSIYGNLIVVGAPNRDISGAANKGAAYIFKRIGHVWNYVTTITATNGAESDFFGTAVTTNGTYVIVGAPYADHSGKTDAGSAYIFGLQNNVWTHQIILKANDPYTDARFGFSLDIWQTRLLVGAPAAYTPHHNGTTSGAAYLFNNTDAAGFTWILGQKITALGNSHNQMEFGYAVAIDGDDMLIGAPNYSGQGGYDGSLGLGCAIQFKLQNNTWSQYGMVTEYGNQARTGTSVALSSSIPLIGMPKTNEGRGRVMVFANPYRDVYDEDPNLKMNFGGAMAAHNGQFVVTCTQYTPYGRIFFGLVEE
jgi:hypothetical protein